METFLEQKQRIVRNLVGLWKESLGDDEMECDINGELVQLSIEHETIDVFEIHGSELMDIFMNTFKHLQKLVI